MSASRMILKVICILLVIAALASIAVGSLMAAGSSLLSGQSIEIEGQAADPAQTARILGGLFAAGGILNLVVGILGIRGANDPRKIGPFKALAAIGVILCALRMGAFASQGQLAALGWSGAAETALVIACLVLAFAAGRQNRR